MSEISVIFGPEGPLAKNIEGFRHRQSQIAMAEKIDSAIKRAGVLVAEAGTGTGKTYAYCYPRCNQAAR